MNKGIKLKPNSFSISFNITVSEKFLRENLKELVESPQAQWL
ncbi:unnamed protein product, partial [marine sediment metagenome]